MPERSGGKGVPDKLPKKYRGNNGKFKNIKILGAKKKIFSKILKNFLNPRIFFSKFFLSPRYFRSEKFFKEKNFPFFFSDHSQKNKWTNFGIFEKFFTLKISWT